MAQYVVYMLYCQNNTYYTGYTTDLARRYQDHLAGKCKYTRSFKPLKIAHSWSVEGQKSDAMRLERYIKSLSRQKKEALLSAPEEIRALFAGITTQ
ncbi:MAG: GIY-YIG nuclease family protein [Legionella sp.]|nr:GIY-YIG nuclease family protein [Legionella sp.]